MDRAELLDSAEWKQLTDLQRAGVAMLAVARSGYSITRCRWENGWDDLTLNDLRRAAMPPSPDAPLSRAQRVARWIWSR